ncbi:lysophospholipase L1-like esterase [Chryseobacterium defluvii]|uniref:Lysophospholipase L1-like esterase n=1 Tax=Chryseobacterium defluvii TaxID=160396 RepID=A0A840KF05_9FLAO|nr:SGNH/GDSL hydrolase family protein [Chryseobacterium defluvii]MBB4806598.1 lysophospholipase L1-like esterase [Chryseobacterium defluvii]
MKKILIFSDSLPLARDFPETTLFNETWPELLKKENYHIHQVSIGAATSSDILTQVHYHKTFNPDIVIIQVGIVDCAPRFATKFEVEILRRIPRLGSKILRKINNPELRAKRNISYVSLSAFKNNLKNIKAVFKCEVAFLTILPANDDYEKILPGVKEKIHHYNQAIKAYDHIDLNDMPGDGIMSDHFHINPKGHLFILTKIKHFLSLQKFTKHDE